MLRHEGNRISFLGLLLCAVLGFALGGKVVGAEPDKRPNILLIVGDDIGYADYGCYGGEIQTPNIDRLAADGLRFTQFYNNTVCIPTRYSLMTGLYPRYPSGRIALSDEVTTVAEILRAAGYRTSLSGKWHLGNNVSRRPIDRGFEEYYGLADGCCNFFDPAQKDPPFEGGDLIRDWMHNAEFIRSFPPDFYSTDAIGTHACEQIRRFTQAGDEPFFVHVCFTAAHSPLHAKPSDIAKYKGRYQSGWDALRSERYARQLELGVVDKSWKLPPREPEFPAWEDEPLKDWNADLMAVYAAMVDSMDQNIGRILQELEKSGRAENTIVLVLNDNGGCAAQAGGDDPSVIPGPKEHYVSCGAGWAWVQNTPFRRYKAWCHEGGISTPLVVRWPGRVKPNTLTNEVGHLVDLLPTFLEMTGAEYPTMRGDYAVPVSEGVSLLPVLQGGRRTQPVELYWASRANRALRRDNWKIAWDQDVKRWELYDVVADRTETNDLAKSQPDRVLQMSADWQKWAERTGAVKQLGTTYKLKP